MLMNLKIYFYNALPYVAKAVELSSSQQQKKIFIKKERRLKHNK